MTGFVSKSFKLLAVINAIVSSANNTSFESVFMLRVRSLKIIINNSISKIDPWGNTNFISPKPDET